MIFKIRFNVIFKMLSLLVLKRYHKISKCYQLIINETNFKPLMSDNYD
jgi:hypothetical protein